MDALFSFSSKVVLYAGAFCTSIFAALVLEPEQQGYFFTFLSLAAAYVFVELGLSSAVINFCGHEVVEIRKSVSVERVQRAKARLVGFGRLVIGWFMAGGVVFGVALVGVGLVLFAGEGASASAPLLPWLALCFVLMLDVALLAFFFLMEGLNEVRTVYAYRTLKALILNGVMWLALFQGYGLWAVSIGYAATLPVSLYYILVVKRDLFQQFKSPVAGSPISWKKEVLPFQWRIAVSWMCGYVTSWSITPLTLVMYGAEAAGRVGFTWSIAMGVIAISNSVILFKAPLMSQLVAERNFALLDRVALKYGGASVILAALGGSGVLALTAILNLFGFDFAERMLSIEVAAYLFIGIAVLQVTQPMAVYLRAHKREPFLVVSIGFSILFILLVVGLRGMMGLTSITLAYLLTCLFFVLPVGSFIFFRCRRRWHASV
ncbi:lipopolysaccharide biosynthesis protein [Terasakiella pusilla]|uniref:lipopolysaccharide biosynthesis protein n=1 Tax=Terasakiella pusilla TaxID=64973 RepID=UPI003AA966B0